MRLSRQFFAGLIAGCLLTLLFMSSAGIDFRSAGRVLSPVVAGKKLSNDSPISGEMSGPQPDNHETAVTKNLPSVKEVIPSSTPGPVKNSRLFPSFPLPKIVATATYAQKDGHSANLAKDGHNANLAKDGQAAPHISGNRVIPHKGAPLFKSTPHKFSFHSLGTGDGPTLLVIGGIQGDEPGGFSAASLLSTHYSITRGNLWIVPDLNFASIVKRNRGLFGDMNRKFAHISVDDPEYELVQGIKKILLAEEVDLILNLHDGSGFYSPTWINKLRNPNRWGQSVIIDKVEMDAPRFNKLHHMASQAEEDANKALVHPDHRYFIRNTNTHLGDKEMEKSLSWFAVLNGKPAFGVEASKEFTTEYRSYYHMLIVESFMRQMGIEFERDFDLSPKSVLVALNSNLVLSLYDGKIVLPLDDVRPQLNNLPFAGSTPPEHGASRPLLSLVKENGGWRVAYGNRTLTRIMPQTMPFDHSLPNLHINVDGKPAVVDFGTVIPVKKDFMIHHTPGYRVNAIGATREQNGTEAGVLLQQADFMKRFSVDKKGLLYRVEVYKDKAFCGMVLVDFGTSYQPAPLDTPLTAVRGEESELGY